MPRLNDEGSAVMSRSCSIVIRSCFVASSLVLPKNGAAQTTQNPPPPQPPIVVKEQVEVVATRLPEAPHEVPVSVEVIDGDTLRAIGATNIRDALSLAAGVEVGPGGDAGPAGASPEFWGLRECDAFALLVDATPRGGAA